jgi:hypothetical protein
MGSLGPNQDPKGTAAIGGTTPDLRHRLHGLYEENIAAKILRVAEELLDGNVSYRNPFIVGSTYYGISYKASQVYILTIETCSSEPPNTLP